MTRRDIVDLLLLGALWGAAFLFIRIAVPHFGPIALVEVRVVIAASLLLLLVLAKRYGSHFAGRWRALTIIGAINTAVPFALYAYATRTIPAGFAAVLNSTVPLLGALLGRAFFKEKLGLERGVGLAIGFFGVVILVAPKLTIGGSTLAILAALGGSSLYPPSAHLPRRPFPGLPSLVIASGGLIAAALLLAVPAVVLRPAVNPPMAAWGAVLALAVGGTAYGYVLYFRLLDRVGATGAMATTYLIPLFGMVWGWMFLGERATATMLMGCAFILGGVAVTTGIIRNWVPSRRLPPSP